MNDRVELTELIGPAGGLSFFLDRDRPFFGVAPIPAASPRHGSVVGLQLLYVVWFGKLAGDPVGGGASGFLGSLTVGLNLP